MICYLCGYSHGGGDCPRAGSFKTAFAEEINEPTKIVAEVIAARDKWWIEQIEGIGNGCEILACANECLNIKTCKQWQSLKQSLEVKE